VGFRGTFTFRKFKCWKLFWATLNHTVHGKKCFELGQAEFDLEPVIQYCAWFSMNFREIEKGYWKLFTDFKKELTFSYFWINTSMKKKKIVLNQIFAFISTLYICKLQASFQLRGWRGICVTHNKDKSIVCDLWKATTF